MFTKLSLISDENLSFDEVAGLKILQQYNYDYKAAEEAITTEILEKFQYSSEGLWDSIQSGVEWIWDKLKSLWDTFWAWLKRLFGIADKRNASNNYSVFNYGLFPAGYRPSEFENGSSTLPGWSKGNYSSCYMRTTRMLDNFLARVEAISAELSSGNIYKFYQNFISNIGKIQNDVWPIEDFRYMIQHLDRAFNGIVTFNIDEADRRFSAQARANQNMTNPLTTNNIANLVGNINMFVTFTRSPDLYTVSDPYASTSGWNAGTVYRDYLEDGRGRYVNAQKIFVDSFDKFNKNCVKALFREATAYFNKANAQKKFNIINNTFSNLTGNDVFVSNQYAKMCVINEMFGLLQKHLAAEMAMIRQKLDLNARAISNDINYQKEHSGLLGGR